MKQVQMDLEEESVEMLEEVHESYDLDSKSDVVAEAIELLYYHHKAGLLDKIEEDE